VSSLSCKDILMRFNIATSLEKVLCSNRTLQVIQTLLKPIHYLRELKARATAQWSLELPFL